MCITLHVLREKKNEHTILLLINAKFLPLHFLYCKTLSQLMHDVSTASVPLNIRNLFAKTSRVHSYNTHSSTSDNFYVKTSRRKIQKTPFQELVLNFGMRHQALWENYQRNHSNSELETNYYMLSKIKIPSLRLAGSFLNNMPVTVVKNKTKQNKTKRNNKIYRNK